MASVTMRATPSCAHRGRARDARRETREEGRTLRDGMPAWGGRRSVRPAGLPKGGVDRGKLIGRGGGEPPLCSCGHAARLRSRGRDPRRGDGPPCVHPPKPWRFQRVREEFRIEGRPRRCPKRKLRFLTHRNTESENRPLPLREESSSRDWSGRPEKGLPHRSVHWLSMCRPFRFCASGRRRNA